jgi:translation initiation factor 2 subunit 2
MAEDLDATVNSDEENKLDFELSFVGKKKKKKRVPLIPDADVTSKACNKTGDYTYTELLARLFAQLGQRNSDRLKAKQGVPIPCVTVVGSKKTVWTNFHATCIALHRRQDHVMAFIEAEFVTNVRLDGRSELIICGKFVQEKVQNVLKKYIKDYVRCHLCYQNTTKFERDNVTRLYFVECDSCHGKRSVPTIQHGFRATSRKDRRALKNAS